jgi:ribosomal protein S18 acetylase RimI-like enzyme
MTDIRPLTAEHRQAVQAFVERIPQRDRSSLDRTLLTQVAVNSWTQAVPARRSIVVEDGAVVALVTVDPGTGWVRHVGDLRVIVQPDRRGQGLGQALVREGLSLAASLGLEKLTVEIMSTNSGAESMFGAFGFVREAVLHDHVEDGDGEYQDLVLLSLWLDGHASS